MSVLTTVQRPRQSHSRRRGAPQNLLNRALFRLALKRQLKQADRFEEPFGLVSISLESGFTAPVSLLRAVEAVIAAARPTDIVGWIEEGRVIGIIRFSAELAPAAAALALQREIQNDIDRRLGASSGVGAGCGVFAEVYTPGSTLLGAVEFDDSSEPAPRGLQLFMKRVVDIVVGATALAVVSPLMLLVAAIVRCTSSGPALVKQERIGEGGRPFRMLKFRTMHVNAGHELHQEYVHHYIRGDCGATPMNGEPPIFKIVADPRVTAVGHFLRRSSLDELPQLWNVVKGEMSLVGPRPPLSYEVKWYRPWHNRRVMDAKPGMTGLWQVKGRSQTTFDEMVRLDLRYARNQSVWQDVKILFATPRAVVSGKGAL